MIMDFESMQEMPKDIKAEVEILGCILANNKKMNEAIEIINSDDFYNSANKEIFEAMIKMFMKDKPIDIVSLSYQIGKEDLKKIGGVTYLSELSGTGLSSTNIKSYCEIVKDKSKRRNLIKASSQIMQNAYNDRIKVDELIDKTQSMLLENTNSKEPIVDDVDLMTKTLSEIERRYQNGGEIPGLKTGLKTLDNATNGLQRGDLTIIAARPSMGKTLVSLNLADNLGKNGYKTAIFEMEMTQVKLGMRRLAYLSLIDSSKIQRGSLTSEEWNRITVASDNLAKNKNIFTDVSVAMSVMDIKAKCKKLKQNKGLDVIIIDHLTLMKMPKAERRDLQIGEITNSLKNLAKELDICVILLSQLSREIAHRGDKRPLLTDLRDSGSIEQDADLIIGLHREEYYNPETEDKGIIEMIIMKQRDGKVGTLKFGYVDKYQKIMELDYRR
jgi:replicative DNA helicase